MTMLQRVMKCSQFSREFLHSLSAVVIVCRTFQARLTIGLAIAFPTWHLKIVLLWWYAMQISQRNKWASLDGDFMMSFLLFLETVFVLRSKSIIIFFDGKHPNLFSSPMLACKSLKLFGKQKQANASGDWIYTPSPWDFLIKCWYL